MEKRKIKDRYELLNKISEGAFGEVYLCVDTHTFEKRAIKIISKDKLEREYFIKEVEGMKLTDCENSIKVYDTFEDYLHYYIIMELCDIDLEKFVEICYPNGVPLKLISYLFSQLNGAFKIMLKKKIIHRDLKPANFLIKFLNNIKTKYVVKLSDFGLATQMKDQKYINNEYGGTLYYTAPEIIKMKPYTKICDLWSIGIILYKLYFNSHPLCSTNALNPKEVLTNVLNEKLFIKKSGNKDFDDLISQLLVFDVKKRIGWVQYFNHPFFGFYVFYNADEIIQEGVERIHLEENLKKLVKIVAQDVKKMVDFKQAENSYKKAEEVAVKGMKDLKNKIDNIKSEYNTLCKEIKNKPLITKTLSEQFTRFKTKTERTIRDIEQMKKITKNIYFDDNSIEKKLDEQKKQIMSNLSQASKLYNEKKSSKIIIVFK